MSTTALSTLVITIERHHKEVQTHGKKTGEAVHACGLALIEAKRQVGPGKWIGWVKDNLSFGKGQAQKYMKIGHMDAARMRHFDSFTEALEEARRDTRMEDYVKTRVDKMARLRDHSSTVVTEEDRATEKQRVEEEKKLNAQMDLMVKLVKAGYRTLAPAHHPDTGGSHDAMMQLTTAKDALLALIEEERS